MKAFKYFKLVDRRAIPVADLIEWAIWFESAECQVAITLLDDVMVSTIFLGMDHQHGEGDPLLFETMVFVGDGVHDRMNRYFIWEEAEVGHYEIVGAIRAEMAHAELAAADACFAVIQRMKSNAAAG